MMKQATSLKRVLNVEVKNSWGNELVYPLDETGKLLVKLLKYLYIIWGKDT